MGFVGLVLMFRETIRTGRFAGVGCRRQVLWLAIGMWLMRSTPIERVVWWAARYRHGQTPKARVESGSSIVRCTVDLSGDPTPGDERTGPTLKQGATAPLWALPDHRAASWGDSGRSMSTRFERVRAGQLAVAVGRVRRSLCSLVRPPLNASIVGS